MRNLARKSDSYHLEMVDKSVLSNPNIIGLDTMSEITIFRPDLMLDIKSCDSLLVTGINRGVKPLTINEYGCSVIGINAHVSKECVGNILSFADARDNSYSLQWDQAGDEFHLQVFENGEIYTFKRHGVSESLYLCDLSNAVTCIATVSENLKFYTKRERVMANKARLLQRRLGFMPSINLIKMINSGLILNCEVGQSDVERADAIYGIDIGQLKGKSKASKAPAMIIEDVKPAVVDKQVAHTDIMFVNKKPFLVTLFTETEYTMITRIKSRNTKDVIPALIRHVLEMRKQGFKVEVIRSDGEGAIAYDDEAKADLLKIGITVDLVAAGEAVPRIERKIQTIKERARCVTTTLPYRLARKLEDSVMIWATNRVNIAPTKNTTEYITPREKVYGRKIDYKVDAKHGFGEYVQILNAKTDNSMVERSRGAVALMPTGNRDGSWYFMTLDNSNVVRRRRSRALPMPTEVINRLNQLHDEEQTSDAGKRRFNAETPRNNWELQGHEDLEDQEVTTPMIQHTPAYNEPLGDRWEFTYEPEEDSIGESYKSSIPANDLNLLIDTSEQAGQPAEANNLTESNEIYAEESKSADPNQWISEIVQGDEQPYMYQETPEMLRDIPSTVNETNRLATEETTVDIQENIGINQPARVITQGEGRILRPNRALPGRWRKCQIAHITKANSKNMTVKRALDKLGEQAEESIRQEMIMVIRDKEAFKPVSFNSLTYSQHKSIIPSKMFLKEKHNASGEFEKLKSRLVAGGHRQDKEVFDNISSATVSTSSVLMVAAIAAMEKRSVAVIDFPGAYLNSKLPKEHPSVYMRLDKEITRIACEIDPKYKEFIRQDGTVIVKLLKALYGCVQSSSVWYDLLTTKLGGIGYIKNTQDSCVFNKLNAEGKQVTVVIHVDDIMITTEGEANLSKEIQLIEEKFGELTITRGKKLSYLGMNFDFTNNNKAIITMEGFTNDLLSDMNGIIDGVKETPASKNLFTIGESELLNEKEKEFFHSTVARLLYIAKRVRPDILLAISYLAKRVQSPNLHDYIKLERVIKYLRGSSELGIILEANINLHVLAWIDASHAVHDNHRSHTGTIISLGHGPIYQKSTSQKINTKSSTESEMVGLSDSSSQVIWTRNFLIEQGYTIQPATIFQDNTSTMFLVKNGKSNSERTKHIATRFYFIKDRVDKNEIKIEHLQTSEMIADILTKPLSGLLFFKLRALLLNWS